MINHEDVLTAPGLSDFHNVLREIAIADTDLFELWDLANEVDGYEDDVLSSGVGEHLLNLQCNNGDRRDDDADSLFWPVDSDWASEPVDSTLSALPPQFASAACKAVNLFCDATSSSAHAARQLRVFPLILPACLPYHVL